MVAQHGILQDHELAEAHPARQQLAERRALPVTGSGLRHGQHTQAPLFARELVQQAPSARLKGLGVQTQSEHFTDSGFWGKLKLLLTRQHVHEEL